MLYTIDQPHNVLEFHQILFCGVFFIMGQKTLLWRVKYDPPQHDIRIPDSWCNLDQEAAQTAGAAPAGG